MKVFGIGMSKTGTWSLTKALQRLGFKAMHFPRPPTKENTLSAAKEYDAVTDIVVIPIYKELADLYPDSKFILTIRDIDSWLDSCEHHFRILAKGHVADIRRKVYGTTKFDRRKLIIALERHLKDVELYFEGIRNRLLVLDIIGGNGYEELCPFLSLPIISEKFPHTNKRKRRNRVSESNQ